MKIMLKIGTPAPPFEATAVDGSTASLAALSGKPVILYFFPKAFTPNCTIETKGFRDNYGELAQVGFEVIGVSTDSHDTQCRFAKHHGITFPMIGDADLTITTAYDVLWPIIPFSKRVTYVLTHDHLVAAAFRHEFQASKHLDEVLRFARNLKAQLSRAQ